MKKHIIEVGNLDSTFGWNSIRWTHEVELTDVELNNVIQSTNAIQIFPNEWYYNSTSNNKIYLRIKQK